MFRKRNVFGNILRKRYRAANKKFCESYRNYTGSITLCFIKSKKYAFSKKNYQISLTKSVKNNIMINIVQNYT